MPHRPSVIRVFELPVLPLDITEYQVFHGHYQHCDAVSRATQNGTQWSDGAASDELHIGTRWEYHLVSEKSSAYCGLSNGVTFSVRAISEAQGRISSMLTPTHHALKRHIQKAPVIHADGPAINAMVSRIHAGSG